MLKVMYFQHPSPNCDLIVLHASGNERKLRTDKKGEVFLEIASPEKYHLAAWVFEHGAAGEFEYEAYKGLMHGTTLTINLPAGEKGKTGQSQ